jgi:metal-dependent hydrolase (beta-lactamase superfamily II)
MVVSSTRCARAREVSSVDKDYALVGGFQLAPAPADYLAKIMAELKTLDIELIFCTAADRTS